MSNSPTSRRGFLLGLPAGMLAATVQAAPAQPAKRQRRIIGDSPFPTFSRAVEYGGIVYVAGVVGQAPGEPNLISMEFAAQCRQAMQNLKASVQAAGSSMSQVLKCGVFLTDYQDFPKFNEIYTPFFPHDPPARSTVVVKELVVPGAKIEIDCVTCTG